MRKCGNGSGGSDGKVSGSSWKKSSSGKGIESGKDQNIATWLYLLFVFKKMVNINSNIGKIRHTVRK